MPDASEMKDSPLANTLQALTEMFLFKLPHLSLGMESNPKGVVKEMLQCFEFLCFKGLFTLINFLRISNVSYKERQSSVADALVLFISSHLVHFFMSVMAAVDGTKQMDIIPPQCLP